MVHQLITIAEFPEASDTAWTAFDRRLEAAIDAVEVAASIRLRADMGHSVELVRWLEGWSLRFREHHKALISIAEDPAQRQCLELSHPNMELIYVSSINELPRTLLRLSRQQPEPQPHPVIPTPEKPVPPAMEKPVPTAADADSSPLPKPPVYPPSLHRETASHPATPPPPAVKQPIGGVATELSTLPPVTTDESICTAAGFGITMSNSRQVVEHTLIEIAGEYRCDNCGTTRMFCKGDIADRCENRECISTRTSFTLQFDLF